MKPFTTLSIFLLLFTVATFSAKAQGSAFGTSTFGGGEPTTEDEPDLTTIAFEESDFDFGTVTAGEMIKHTFVFTNTGENELIIDNVKPSCTCAKLEFPDTPIAPGQKGEIVVHFDTAGKSGKQEKNLTVIYNGNPPIERVFFHGIVLESGLDESQHSPEE